MPSRRLPASKKDNAWAGCNAGYLDVIVWLHLCELLAMVEHVLNLQFLKYTEWRKKPRSFDMTAQTTVLQNYQYIFISR